MVVFTDELHQKTGCRDPVRGGPERPHPGTDPPQEAVRGVPAPHQESESRGAGIQIVQHDSTVHQGTVVVRNLIMGNLKNFKNCLSSALSGWCFLKLALNIQCVWSTAVEIRLHR